MDIIKNLPAFVQMADNIVKTILAERNQARLKEAYEIGT